MRTWRWSGAILLGLLFSGACAPASLVDVQPPSGIVDPAVVATAAGAMGLYPYAINSSARVYGGQIGNTCGPLFYVLGDLTDELIVVNGGGLGARQSAVGDCGGLESQQVNQPRVEARQAREALALYAPTTSVALQGRLAGNEAYAMLLLAEDFCSGIPLSTVSFTGVTTRTVGYTTDDVFAAAATLFDTAIALSADSTRFVYMATIGKARALVGRGKLAEAAQAVQGVPTDFVYTLTYTTSPNYNFFGNAPRNQFTQDREGTNGLVWSTDPRTAIVTTPALSSTMPYSAKYSKTAAGVLDPTQTITNNPIWLASGVEARLIEAEADLAAGGSNWLTILNTLRTTCIGASACAPVPGLTAAALPPLIDPGTPDARLNLLMRERAMWLFLTGHREGDLRRLAHLYHRPIESTWPTGVYVNPGFPPLIPASSQNGIAYGTTTVLAPGTSETTSNPLYMGCFNLDP